MIGQRQLLVDHADAEVTPSAWGGHVDDLALDLDGAGILLVDTAQDLHEGRLAGTVLADERVHLSRTQLEPAVLQRLHAGERLVDALHPQPHVVIEIVRYRQNDFVAWTRQRRNGNAVCLIAPRGDGDVLGAYAGFIIGAEMPGESNAQLEGARNVAVKGSGWLNRNRSHVTRQSFGRLVAGSGLCKVQQLLVGGKCTPAYPLLSLGYRRRDHGADERITVRRHRRSGKPAKVLET